MVIHDAATWHGADANGVVTLVHPGTGKLLGSLPGDRHAEIAIRLYWHRRDRAPYIPESQALRVSVQAQVNDNRWLAVCPSCNSAQLTSKTDPRFFCIDCLSADHGGQWVAVAWPDDIDGIEAELVKRPVASTRSWEPHETVADLAAQNIEHGIT
jgi:hypothetical protein